MNIYTPETKIRVVDQAELASNLAAYAEKTSRVASNGFGLGDTMNPERTSERLRRYPNLVVAEQEGEVVGFQAYTLRETASERYLYYLLAVNKANQGQGIGRSMLSAAIEHGQPTLVGARTQNPATLLSFTRTVEEYGATEVFPLTQGENDTLAADLPAFLSVQGLSEIVSQTGLSKGVYAEGRLGDYQVRSGNPAVQAIDNRLQEIGLNRDLGDAVFFFARIAPPLVPS